VLLYIVSSLLFIFLSAYWYYFAQKSMLESNEYYRLQHIADTVSREIIHAHMQGKELALPKGDADASVALVDVDAKVTHGAIAEDFFPNKAEFLKQGEYSILVSDAPQRHLDVRFVVVSSRALSEQIKDLKQIVLGVMFFVVAIMISLAWIFSKLFMRPLRQKIEQIEGFVHDTAHELNTPITALSMSVSRALKKGAYDEKILKNILISTRQLFDIYTALAYLSFETKKEKASALEISRILKKSVAYYKELSESKRVSISVEAEAFMFEMDEAKLSMLFGNLISNAIKYSLPNSTIQITLKAGIFTIKDHGIGIDKERLGKIFERYSRGTDYAGGFGIGLSIVRKICQEHKIGLQVSSEKEKGSCFVLSFLRNEERTEGAE
jgi:two-component system OmpR family sensor kinase